MSKIICPDCRQLIDWPINNPDGTFCPECGGFINVVSPPADPQEVAASTTSDPQAAYGKKREPMLKDEDMVRDLWDENANGERNYWSEPWDIDEVRDHYESLIASGELIVKSELVEWLEEKVAELEGLMMKLSDNHTKNRLVGTHNAYRVVLDHINKKGSITP